MRYFSLVGLLSLAGLLATTACVGGVAEAQTSTWSSNTAVPIPQGRWEFGIFHQLHWGVTDEIELSTHPILPLVMPHLEAKILWRERYPFYIASRHRLTYPTVLLGLLSRDPSHEESLERLQRRISGFDYRIMAAGDVRNRWLP